jgi:hypothetical protein
MTLCNGTLMKHYMIMANVTLRREATWEAEGIGKMVGYYRNIAVNAISVTEALEYLKGTIDDGDIDWKELEWHERTLKEFDTVIRKHYVPIKGIWYKSGRVYYPNF